MEFDPSREGGHLRPNLDLEVVGETAPVRFITNSKGFRNDREFDYGHPPGAFRVLLTGDSYVDGMRTDQRDTIGHVLEQRLERAGRPAEVMISGHNNPANAWYGFQEHGYKYAPDLVILGVTLGNDLVSQNLGFHLHLSRGEDGRVRLRASEDMKFAGPTPKDVLPAGAFTAEGQGSLTEWVEDRELELRKGLAKRSARFGYIVPPALFPMDGPSGRRHVFAADIFVSPGLFCQPLTRTMEKAYDDFCQVAVGLDQAVRAAGGRLLVVIFPVRMQVDDGEWGDLVRFYSLDPERFDLMLPNRRILDCCRRNGIDCLDVTPGMRAWLQAHGEPLYRRRGDMHFNEAGQRVVGELIGEHLIEQEGSAGRH